jgi:glycosyltransferase involved in cell wall biosynthesis
MGRRIHVVQLVATLREGGAEALIRALVPRLLVHGVDVTVVSVYPSRCDAHDREALGVPVIEIGRAGRRDVRFFPRLVATLRELKPDIVHTHLHTGKFAGRVAALAAGVPSIVFTEHGDEAGGLGRQAINAVLHPRTRRFVVFTNAQRADFARTERVPAERIAVIPNGIAPVLVHGERSALRAHLALDEHAFAIFIPARLAHQKNQSLALRALAKPGADPRWTLVLAGDGHDREALVREAHELGVGSRVRFLGYRSDVRMLNAAMDAFAMPSRWERMPLALGEAMIDGLAVVSAPWAGVHEFIDDGISGFIAADFTASAFADALHRCTGDTLGRARVISAAHAFASQRFDLDASARAHVALYASLVRRP